MCTKLFIKGNKKSKYKCIQALDFTRSQLAMKHIKSIVLIETKEVVGMNVFNHITELETWILNQLNFVGIKTYCQLAFVSKHKIIFLPPSLTNVLLHESIYLLILS